MEIYLQFKEPVALLLSSCFFIVFICPSMFILLGFLFFKIAVNLTGLFQAQLKAIYLESDIRVINSIIYMYLTLQRKVQKKVKC